MNSMSEQQIKGITVTAMSTGEIRVTADLYPEEAKHGALVRGLTAEEARQHARVLLAAADETEAGSKG
jgi:hypothetical protein